MKLVDLLKYPYPFKAAFTISNDIDCTRYEDFILMHQFLNTGRQTKLGRGLALELSNSFWMFSVKPEFDRGFSYFEDLEAKRKSEYSAKMEEFIKAGLLDTMHTYGNYSHFGGFKRVHAEKAYETLSRIGVPIRVWVNHGGIHNFQNFKSSAYLGHGDIKCIFHADGTKENMEEYHLDLTYKLGVRFIWKRIDDNDPTLIAGQNRRLPFSTYLRYKMTNKSKNAKIITAIWQLTNWKKTVGDFNNYNKILIPDTLDSKYQAAIFRRYGKFGQDHLDHLLTLISRKKIDQLIANRGTMILFVHLGKINQIKHIVQPMKNIAEQFRVGDLFVRSLKNILIYHYVHEQVELDYKKNKSELKIIIKGLGNNYLALPVTENLFEGISFKCPSNLTAYIWLNNKKLQSTVFKSKVQYSVIQVKINYQDFRSVL